MAQISWPRTGRNAFTLQKSSSKVGPGQAYARSVNTAYEPLADSSESEVDNEVDLDGILLSKIQTRIEGNVGSND